MLDPNLKLLTKTIFDSLCEIKAQDIIGLDLESVQSYADFIFVASGNNIRQVQALADNIQKRVFEICKRHPLGVEGYEHAQWILVDFGDIICHIFFEEVRKNYKIEDMWPSVEPLNETKLAKLFSAANAKTQKAAPKKVSKKPAPQKNTKKAAAQKSKPTRAAKPKTAGKPKTKAKAAIKSKSKSVKKSRR